MLPVSHASGGVPPTSHTAQRRLNLLLMATALLVPTWLRVRSINSHPRRYRGVRIRLPPPMLANTQLSIFYACLACTDSSAHPRQCGRARLGLLRRLRRLLLLLRGLLRGLLLRGLLRGLLLRRRLLRLLLLRGLLLLLLLRRLLLLLRAHARTHVSVPPHGS
jgi:hypothetical protein